MSKRLTQIGVVVLVIVMAFGVIGTAAAQGPDGRKPRQSSPRQGAPVRDRVIGALIDAVADVTGLTREEVLPELQAGKTCADVLEEHGLDPLEVSDALLAALTVEVNQALTDGKISAENAARILEELPERLEAAMNKSLPNPIRDRAVDRMDRAIVEVLAEMAGVEARVLMKEALTPPSLAEIAKNHGLDVDAVIAAIEARITEEVNQAVTDGKITAENAADILDWLHDRLVKRFDQPIRLPRPSIRPGTRPGPGRQGQHGQQGQQGQGI